MHDYHLENGVYVMNFTQEEIENALKILQETFPDSKVNNNKTINFLDLNNQLQSTNFYRKSMKRSHIQNYKLKSADLLDNAFVGSLFENVKFFDCNIQGNSFVSCDFFDSSFICQSRKKYSGNNFSQSSFMKGIISNITFDSSSFIKTLFESINIDNCCFQGCTLDGLKLSSCELKNVDLGNVNAEFLEIINSTLESVTFPFYQVAYIIGISDYIQNDNLLFKAENKIISSKDYILQINNLIIFYYEQNEFFPICNLYIMKNDIESAKKALLNGINVYLERTNFHIIRHLCRLAQRHNLLDEFTTQKILRTLEKYVTSDKIPIESLNKNLIDYGELRNMLLAGNSNSVVLSLKVKTNICKKNSDGIIYVNDLCNKLNKGLSENDFGQTGFQIAVSNHSPFEILIEVVCFTSGLVTIANFIWKIIDNHKIQKKQSETHQITKTKNEIFHQYTNARVEQYKQQLLNMKANYSKRKMNQYIEEITQQLKTDINSFYDKEIIIFTKDNRDL